jgi:hypothetical protein
MLNYMITEDQRREILHSLEWAEWALEVSMQTARDEAEENMRQFGKPGAAADVIENLTAEKSAIGYLWDALNQMEPTDA